MPWTYVQSATGHSVLDFQVSLSSASPPGALIVVAVSVYNQNLIDVRDNATSAIFTKAKALLVNQIGIDLWWWISTGGASVRTVRTSGANYSGLIVAEFAAPTTISADGTNGAGATSTSPASGNVAVTGSDLVLGALATGGIEGTVTPGSGYTLATSLPWSNGVNEGIFLTYKLNTTTNPEAPTYALANSTLWTMAGAGLKIALPAGSLLRPPGLSLGRAGRSFVTQVNG